MSTPDKETIKIHPFDLYILIRDNPDAKVVEHGREVEVAVTTEIT